MKKLFWIVLIASGLSLFSCRVVVDDRPTPPVYVRPAAPSTNYVWIDGGWHPRRRAYSWREGYWSKPRTNYTYRSGTWKQTPKGYYWNKGRWQKEQKMNGGRNNKKG